MPGIKEAAAEVAYRLAMREGISYGLLKSIARSKGQRTPELLAEVLRICRERGIDASRLATTTPLHLQYKLGIAGRPVREKKARAVSSAGMEFPSSAEREAWAHSQGFPSWEFYYEKKRKEEHVSRFLELYLELRRKGYADAEERARAVLGKSTYVPKILIRHAEEKAGLAAPKKPRPGSIWRKKPHGKHF